jgi:hypothetical protein
MRSSRSVDQAAKPYEPTGRRRRYDGCPLGMFLLTANRNRSTLLVFSGGHRRGSMMARGAVPASAEVRALPPRFDPSLLADGVRAGPRQDAGG